MNFLLQEYEEMKMRAMVELDIAGRKHTRDMGWHIVLSCLASIIISNSGNNGNIY